MSISDMMVDVRNWDAEPQESEGPQQGRGMRQMKLVVGS